LGFYRDGTFPTRFNVAQVIDDVLSLYARRKSKQAGAGEKRYVDRASFTDCWERSRQAISKSGANAVDAMPNSGGTMHIACGGQALARTVLLCESRSLIPEWEYQSSCKSESSNRFHDQEQTGTGLGLWLTKEHRGKASRKHKSLELKCRKDGTVFLLTLPESDFSPCVRLLPLRRKRGLFLRAFIDGSMNRLHKAHKSRRLGRLSA